MSTKNLPLQLETADNIYNLTVTVNGPLKNNRYTFTPNAGLIKIAIEDHPTDEKLKIVTCPRIGGNRAVIVKALNSRKTGEYTPAGSIAGIMKRLWIEQLQHLEQIASEDD